MTNEEILANAPEGATHVELLSSGIPYYLKHELSSFKNSYQFYDRNNQWSDLKHGASGVTRSLSDIRRIAELEKELLDWKIRHQETSARLGEVCQRAETAERERDDFQRKLSALSYCIKNQVSNFYDARNYEEAVNVALEVLGKFAIEQRKDEIERCKQFFAGMDLDWRELSSQFDSRLEQLRQQLNGGE